MINQKFTYELLIYYRVNKHRHNTYHIHIVNYLSNARTQSHLSSMIMGASIQIQRQSNAAKTFNQIILLNNVTQAIIQHQPA